MEIPKKSEIIKLALELLKDGNEMKAKDFERPLAKLFSLNEEEVNKLYDSGNGPIFLDRIQWSLSSLSRSKLVDKPKRGVYKINATGLESLQTPDKIETYVQKQLKQRKPIDETKLDAELTPKDNLEESYNEIRESSHNEILDTILDKSPRAFEYLVVNLLQKMGYGGTVKDASTVTKGSHDGGIDGVIKEDVLGLGRIHIQAKRYERSNVVGREEIQKFVGALAVAQSNKGIFITTSDYSKGAKDYANNLNGNTNVVLINGDQLAKYIYDFSLGMQTEQIIELKKMDSDFWDNLQDE